MLLFRFSFCSFCRCYVWKSYSYFFFYNFGFFLSKFHRQNITILNPNFNLIYNILYKYANKHILCYLKWRHCYDDGRERFTQSHQPVMLCLSIRSIDECIDKFYRIIITKKKKPTYSLITHNRKHSTVFNILHYYVFKNRYLYIL